MLNIWSLRLADLWAHDHDALTFQYPEHLEAEILPQILDNLIVPLPLANGRTLRIPYDCKVGWNKGEFDAKTNPDGLADWSGNDTRKRQPKVPLLDRKLRGSHR